MRFSGKTCGLLALQTMWSVWMISPLNLYSRAIFNNNVLAQYPMFHWWDESPSIGSCVITGALAMASLVLPTVWHRRSVARLRLRWSRVVGTLVPLSTPDAIARAALLRYAGRLALVVVILSPIYFVAWFGVTAYLLFPQMGVMACYGLGFSGSARLRAAADGTGDLYGVAFSHADSRLRLRSRPRARVAMSRSPREAPLTSPGAYRDGFRAALEIYEARRRSVVTRAAALEREARRELPRGWRRALSDSESLLSGSPSTVAELDAAERVLDAYEQQVEDALSLLPDLRKQRIEGSPGAGCGGGTRSQPRRSRP